MFFWSIQTKIGFRDKIYQDYKNQDLPYQIIIINNFLFKILMKRQLKKEQLAKLYREFSRQKYNKYRHQFPRMRESELVSKIIKEWQGLSLQQKQQLFDTYTSEKHISAEKGDDKSESSERKESPGSSKDKKKKSQSKSVSKGPRLDDSSTPAKKSGVRVFEKSSSQKKEKAQSQSSDFARDGVKKDFQVSESVSKELGVPTGKTASKKKKITKLDSTQPRTEYLKFFKFYYEKLTKEHPRWQPNQISTIIKLLWKKKIVTEKNASKLALRAPKQRRRMSGRLTFRKAYNYTGIQGAERWKQLPVESKRYWKIKGEGIKSGERKGRASNINFKRTMRKGSESSINTNQSGKNLSFMKKTMS